MRERETTKDGAGSKLWGRRIPEEPPEWNSTHACLKEGRERGKGPRQQQHHSHFGGGVTLPLIIHKFTRCWYTHRKRGQTYKRRKYGGNEAEENRIKEEGEQGNSERKQERKRLIDQPIGLCKLERSGFRSQPSVSSIIRFGGFADD
mmetsp:Transcript_26852/g.52722  ORF Transcript_26852/g.52722 Transcript_26852/m.52722 type:complete len:147 (-) Transcript_26852:1679-2119(-)